MKKKNAKKQTRESLSPVAQLPACPSRGVPPTEADTACPSCGAPLATENIPCTACGAPIVPNTTVCAVTVVTDTLPAVAPATDIPAEEMAKEALAEEVREDALPADTDAAKAVFPEAVISEGASPEAVMTEAVMPDADADSARKAPPQDARSLLLGLLASLDDGERERLRAALSALLSSIKTNRAREEAASAAEAAALCEKHRLEAAARAAHRRILPPVCPLGGMSAAPAAVKHPPRDLHEASREAIKFWRFSR